MSEENLISVKELAGQLKQTDALIKKLLKDFSISTTRVKKRIHVSTEALTVIKGILALKESGKKTKEIEEIVKDDKSYLSVRESQEELLVDDVKNESKKEILNEDLESSSEPIETEAPKENNFRKKDRYKNKRDRRKKNFEKKPDHNQTPEEKKEEESDFSEYLNENLDNSSLDEIQKDIEEALESDEEGELPLEEHFDIQEEEAGPLGSEKKSRRRRFNFRYIQRQIANDSKKINYIKNKLRRSRLSTLERINLQDTLDKRSKMLNGWIHLLRWVKS